MPAETFHALLAGGDRRSVGRAATVVALLGRDPDRVAELIPLLRVADPVVVMRAADVLEKFSGARPEVLQPHRRALLALLPRAEQQELRWHLAQLIPRLLLTPVQRTRAVEALECYLEAESGIVRTFALQALFDLTRSAPRLRPRVERHLRAALRHGTPAMTSRARRLLAEIE